MFRKKPSAQGSAQQTATPFPDERHLLHDLILEVPGQDQHIIGVGLSDPFGLFVFLFLLFAKFLPSVSMTELKEDMPPPMRPTR